MNRELIGKTLKTVQTKVLSARISELEQLLGTTSARDAASLSVFFGLTIGRDLELPKLIGMAMDRTLMLGHDVSWSRPFLPDEDVHVSVSLADLQDKPDRVVAVIDTVFVTPAGEEIQRQKSTFVTYKAARA